MRKVLLAMVALAGVAEAGSHCHEESPIVGRQHCGKFGNGWAHQPLFGIFAYGFGMIMDRIPVPMIDERGTAYNQTGSTTYQATTPGRTMLYGIGPRQRLGFRGEHLILVVEMGFAQAVSAPTLTTALASGPIVVSHHGSVFDAVALVGMHTRVGSLVDVGAEFGTGLRDVSLRATLNDGYTSCLNGSTAKGCGFAVGPTDLLLDARARVDLWVAPQLTLGLSAGYDLVHGGETLALTVGYHAMLFDGQ